MVAERKGSRAMPEERLRFRCYRCNQLMGTSAKRVGTTVTCPHCKAELKVPGPGEQTKRRRGR